MSLTATLSGCIHILLAHLIRLLFIRFLLFVQLLIPFHLVSRSTLAFAILLGHQFLNHLPSLVLAFLPGIIWRLIAFISGLVYDAYYWLNLRKRAEYIPPSDSFSPRKQNPSQQTRRSKSVNRKRVHEPSHSYNLRRRHTFSTHEPQVKTEQRA